MKRILTIILLLCSIVVFGQNEKIITTPYFIIDTTKIDTIPVIMLVSLKNNGTFPSIVYSQKGYSIKKHGSVFSTYLKSNKEPVPSAYMVWMSVAIKEE